MIISTENTASGMAESTDPPRHCHSVTGQEMCELISEWLWEVHGARWSPEAIWDYSPTGELSEVFLMYAQAIEWKRSQ